jgi:fructosamine-3-kinase
VPTHPLLAPPLLAAVRQAASQHRNRPWTPAGFTDLDDRAAHPCGIFSGSPFSVFAKLSLATDGRRQFEAELAGRALIASKAAVGTPVPVASGIVAARPGWLLLFEAVAERTGNARTRDDLAAIGATIAALHEVRSEQGEFGLPDFNGYFGPIPQDNRPVPAGRWPDFYAERRIEPMLRLAIDSGNLPATVSDSLTRLLPRLPDLCGSDPVPSLLHGDAQQNNFLCTPHGILVIDTAPYFGHPELDLALVDYFEPAHQALFDGYRAVAAIDAGFAERRELWRIFAYLAVIACDGKGPLGRGFVTRLADALRRYG